MRTLRVVAALLAVAYATVFLATFADPVLLEKQAEDYLREQLKTTVTERVEVMKEGTASGLAQVLSRRNTEEIKALEADLESGLEAQLNAVISIMRDPSCECRRYIERGVHQGTVERIAALRTQTGVLERIAMEAYGEIVRKLQRDFRIFSGISLLAFLFVILASFLKPKAQLHLVLPSGLLVASTLAASWLYLFEQNWFFTILSNSYVGFSYVIWIALIFGFLLDIAINRRRVTTQIINIIGNALWGAFKAVPC